MEKNDKNKAYISVPELATAMGISRVAVFNKIKKGQIPAQKIGRNYAISVEDISDLINGQVDILTESKKIEIGKAVEKVVREYGETLKLLGKE